MSSSLEKFSTLLNKPYGVILVTGTTGSGKKTTLNGSLSAINDDRKNIKTIEDPVEYQLPGIRQTQVNSKAGVTFATGLRSLMRQDPDIIMVGEIRD
jgi:type II secretory ATPase GspE/PulE/Tfp pilus assembly ATPase PilB-like protein